MKYIKSYQDNTEYDADITKKYPHVGYLKDTKEVIYVNKPDDKYRYEYLTFEPQLNSATFKFTNSINYSIDDGNTWNTLGANTYTPPINIGDKIMFKGTLTPNGMSGIGTFSSNFTYHAKGNPLSLVYGDDFASVTDLTGKDWIFSQLFYGNGNLVNAENISLPATTLSNNCYAQMFCSCSYITKVPELNAQTLSYQCYDKMFRWCQRLTYIKMTASTMTAGRELNLWVDGVSSTGTFVKNASMTTLPTGANGIPTGWTVIDA